MIVNSSVQGCNSPHTPLSHYCKVVISKKTDRLKILCVSALIVSYLKNNSFKFEKHCTACECYTMLVTPTVQLIHYIS